MRLNRNFWALEAIWEGKHCSYGFHYGGWIFQKWYELLISHKIFTLRCTQQAHLGKFDNSENFIFIPKMKKIKKNFVKIFLKNLSKSLNFFSCDVSYKIDAFSYPRRYNNICSRFWTLICTFKKKNTYFPPYFTEKWDWIEISEL